MPTVDSVERKLVGSFLKINGGRGGLLVWSRPRSRRDPVWKLYLTEEPLCKRVWCKLNPTGSADIWRGGASLSVVLVIRPRFKIVRSVPK
ncbi:hypothetical protein AVEN_49954-1 [Araneus ventricosus]|uniref:Uncharacterized protein n=1 Tax=Araneus ventricosus TaxID=182803 RepID=A0A4Y2EET6_ARAVE|nr:hypothetical protein AVEN_49954-1 [Araneus ventricosus]